MLIELRAAALLLPSLLILGVLRVADGFILINSGYLVLTNAFLGAREPIAFGAIHGLLSLIFGVIIDERYLLPISLG